MPENRPLFFFAVYLAAVSLVTVIITVIDKRNAAGGKRRVPEKTLFLLAFLGGALAELCTMKLIRHKTLHKRFMLGLPAVIALHVLLAAAVSAWIFQI